MLTHCGSAVLATALAPLDQQRIFAAALLVLGVGLVIPLARERPVARGWAPLAVLLLVGNAGWLTLHNAYEGPTIIGVGSHGLAVADLGVVPSSAIAVAVLVRLLRRT